MQKKLKNFMIDSFALNSFSYIVSMPIELFIAHMTITEHLITRSSALITNTFFGRPYGIYRNLMIRRFLKKKNDVVKVYTKKKEIKYNPVKKYIFDMFLFVSFQIPLYIINMLVARAEAIAILKSALMLTIVISFIGGPYGLYLDLIRRKFGYKK